MKFRAHETFSIRKGWLHKGIKAIIDNPKVFVDKEKNPQDELGLGSNMVKSLRYWLQATGLASELVGKGMSLTNIGDIIWHNDEFFEEDGTWLLIHYLLSSNENLATSWYYIFNELNVRSFCKEEFVEYITMYVRNQSEEKVPSDRVISDDFECAIKTYYSAKTSADPESNFVCPLSDLGLIKVDDESNKKIYTKVPFKRKINPYIIMAVIINEANKNNSLKEIKISSIQNDRCNIGKTFNLDNILISEYLDMLQGMELIKVFRTAGLDVVQIKTDMNFEKCVQKYYNNIK